MSAELDDIPYYVDSSNLDWTLGADSPAMSPGEVWARNGIYMMRVKPSVKYSGFLWTALRHGVSVIGGLEFSVDLARDAAYGATKAHALIS